MTTGLATIRQILEIVPIEKADKVVRARVTGDIWLVTGTMNNFKVGDWAVYIRPNTFVPRNTLDWLCDPDNPDVFNNVEGGTVRETTIRKHVSNGLILPLNALPHFVFIEAQFAGGGFYVYEYDNNDAVELGHDVSDLLDLSDWASIPQPQGD